MLLSWLQIIHIIAHLGKTRNKKITFRFDTVKTSMISLQKIKKYKFPFGISGMQGYCAAARLFFYPSQKVAAEKARAVINAAKKAVISNPLVFEL